jgi:TM2 domain-containing membrane protein YozV
MSQNENNRKNTLVAALLSLIFLGGGGQIYCGYFKRGLLIIACTIIFAIIGLGMGGLLPLGVGVIDAWSLAKTINKGEHVEEFESIGTLWL